MARPTVYDIAKTAGVSLATVDRVLNARPGVRAATVERVRAAVERLGYVRDVSAANLARQRSYTLVFVLPDGASSFLQALHQAIGEALPRALIDRTHLRVVVFPADNPHRLTELLAGLDRGDVDGVAIMAPETPQLRDAIRRLREIGIAVVALVSDLPNTDRDHFVGINNIAAGRTAAVLLGRFVGRPDARVLVLAGSMLARDHVERRLGFDQVMAARFPGFQVLPSVEGHDDATHIARLLPQVLRTHPDLDAIYSLGAGNRGLIGVLRDTRPLTVVAHELTPHVREALQDGLIDAVIHQDVGHLIRSAIRVLRAQADGQDLIASQERIRIEVYLSENLP